MNYSGKIFTAAAALVLCCSNIFAQEQNPQDTTAAPKPAISENAPMFRSEGEPRLYYIRDVNVHGVQYLNPEILKSSAGLIAGDSVYLPSNFISNAISRLWSQRFFSDVKIGAEIEGDMGDSHVGLQARLMSQALRKLTGVIGKTNTVCIFINQLREKVGIVYGNPEVTTGGRALKYYSSVRIDVRRIEGLKDSTGAFIGNRTRAKIVKNKVAPPFREAEFDIMFGEGISKIGEILDLGVKLGVVQKSGAWFNYGEMRLGQGRDNAKQFLKDHPEVSDEIEKIVRANSDRLLAAGKKGTVKPLDPSEVIKPAAAAEAPAAPAAKTTGSEVDLDIMVDE